MDEPNGAENKDNVFAYYEQYPDIGELLDDGPEPGCWYEYVTSDFVARLAPYIKPVACILLERYRSIRSFQFSKQDCDRPIADSEIEAMLAAPHTKLGSMGDDVVLLGSTAQHWWFLHYDQDVSDCRFGRVRKDCVTEAEAIDWLRCYCEQPNSWTPRAVLPVERFRGWLTF